ncbi:MAG: N-6 DNA methylase [Planctomycetota bacterium]|nr:N-6 DNA methylase [Planctomycetota bacterium]
MAWPNASDLLAPEGAGPRVLADLAKEKIEKTIRLNLAAETLLRVGVLTKNPGSHDSQAPIAVVCEFGRAVEPRTLALAHRLAWNFARSPLLVTIEPHLVRTWTCCEPPAEDAGLFGTLGAEIEPAQLDLARELGPSQQAAHALHWVRLASGDFYRQFPDRFRRDGRADRALLDELTAVRQRLKKQELTDDTIHDLLARVVFIQFLFDRTDSKGRAALNPSLLARLRDEGYLRQLHGSLESILSDYDEAYRFFRWLNDKFNGDLFPGKGETEFEREAEWREEMGRVRSPHLRTLADFVGGRLRGRQRALWRQYSFDVIPLEFMSSIYEEFVTTKGAHYTPSYLVDFMLDEVLPWNGDTWNLRVLDPACGSGIFLVKAYQRLIQRWKNAHPGQKPSTKLLKQLLKQNLFGVDIDPHAVRVASFSLYLTMCDEIDPKSYLKNTQFPRLRGRQLIDADFFQEDRVGFSSQRDGPTYDLVIGNAPWGDKTETEAAREWADHPERKWPIANKCIGTLFLGKAAALTKRNGRVSMIQPASSLLFNRSGPASRFREKLFTQYKVEEVVNLSTLRFELFESATSPPCIVTMRPTAPDDQPLVYMSPKQVKPAGGAESAESSYAIVIEPHDMAQVWPDEAAGEPFVWTALAWGGRRDFALIRKLAEMPSLKQSVESGDAICRNGIERGSRSIKHEAICGWPMLEPPEFPECALLEIDAAQLPINKDPWTHRLTDLTAFKVPQFVIKRSWTRRSGRIQGARVVNAPKERGVLCSQNYVSIHFRKNLGRKLDGAAISYNSIAAVYFLLLTSGRIASYRPNATVDDILSVPLPAADDAFRTPSDVDAVDSEVRRLLGLRDAEWALVEDAFQITLPDFHGSPGSPGRRPTCQGRESDIGLTREPQLAPYCEYFLRVLKAGFGQEQPVCATIYQDALDARLPVRMVAIHLDLRRDEPVDVEQIDSADLCELLLELDEKFLRTPDGQRGGIFFQRTARVYDEARISGKRVPTIYVVKPDRIRYWTRSAALRDADEVAADLASWQTAATGQAKGRKRR